MSSTPRVNTEAEMQSAAAQDQNDSSLAGDMILKTDHDPLLKDAPESWFVSAPTAAVRKRWYKLFVRHHVNNIARKKLSLLQDYDDISETMLEHLQWRQRQRAMSIALPARLNDRALDHLQLRSEVLENELEAVTTELQRAKEVGEKIEKEEGLEKGDNEIVQLAQKEVEQDPNFLDDMVKSFLAQGLMMVYIETILPGKFIAEKK